MPVCMKSPKQPVSVLVLIHTDNLDILMLERAAHPGYWQSVTGSREGSESPIETACREVAEETGLRVAPEHLVDWRLSNTFEIFEEWRHRYAPGVTRNVEHVFSLALPNAVAVTTAPSEHRAQCWLPLQAAADRCFSWTNRDAILMLPQRHRRA